MLTAFGKMMVEERAALPEYCFEQRAVIPVDGEGPQGHPDRSSPKPNSPSRPVWSSKSLSGGRPALQASDLSIEVALLLEVRGDPGCGSVRLERGGRVASPDEEVAADRVEATIGADPRHRDAGPARGRPGIRRPC